MKPLLDPATAAKVLAADVANILKKAKAGRPLSKYERQMVKSATAGEQNITPAPATRRQKKGKSPSPDPQALALACQLVIEGKTAPNIAVILKENYPGSDPQQILAAAAVEFTKAAEEPFELVKGFCMEATREIYKRFMDIHDLDGALKAIKQFNTLATSKKAEPKPPKAGEVEIVL